MRGRAIQTADHRPAPRPGLDRRHGVQLRPRLRRPGHEGRGLLHRRQAGLVPPAREGRQAAQGPRPSQRREIRRCLSRRRRHRRAEENPPLPLHRHAPQANRPADGPQRRPAHDQTPGQGGGLARGNLLPHLPGHRHHRLPRRRRHHRRWPAILPPLSGLSRLVAEETLIRRGAGIGFNIA